jgi:nucleoside-diphosphate-sugar epimerase
VSQIVAPGEFIEGVDLEPCELSIRQVAQPRDLLGAACVHRHADSCGRGGGAVACWRFPHCQADPDLMLHVAAESHVDRSIEGPAAYGLTSSPNSVYIDSNVTGTFHLLQAVRAHWETLPAERQGGFRFHHISTDEVFGSLGPTGRFSETTPYARAAPIRPARRPATTC